MKKIKSLLSILGFSAAVVLGAQSIDAKVSRAEPKHFKNYDELAERVTKDFFGETWVSGFQWIDGGYTLDPKMVPISNKELKEVSNEVKNDLLAISKGENPFRSWSKTEEKYDKDGNFIERRIEMYNDNGHMVMYECKGPDDYNAFGPCKRLHYYSINASDLNDDKKLDFIIESPKGKIKIYLSE